MLKMTLVTPNKKMLMGEEVEEVFVPANRGELNILPGHATVVTTLVPGILKYKLKGAGLYSYAAISWGYCEVFGDNVNVLAETAELPKEIDKVRAELTLKEAIQKLESGTLEPEGIQKYRLKQARAEIRLEVANQAPVSQE